MLKVIQVIKTSFLNFNVYNNLTSTVKMSSSASIFTPNFCNSVKNRNGYIKENNFDPLLNSQRNIFIYRSGDMLWEGVTGPPGRIKKRARGKRRVLRNKVDLNIGRKIGDNAMNYKWPGLNAPISEGKNMMKVYQGEKDEAYATKIVELRNRMNKKKNKIAIPPLKRGWSGARMGGQSCGPPVEILGQKWEGYDSRVLELKMVSSMTMTKGRTRRYSAMIIVGNFQGLAGIGKAKSTTLKNAVKNAKARAMSRLTYFNIRENRTIWHPDYTLDWCTKVYIKPMHTGYGLVCHRMLKSMCQVIGIKDMYAKVEGNIGNYQALARAFMTLLRRQESYQDIANRMALNVVEIRSEADDYPRLLAAPESGGTRTPDPDETLDFDRLHLGGQVFRVNKKMPFYLSMKGPMHFARVRQRFRNQESVHRTRLVYDHLVDEGHFVREAIPTDGGGGRS